MKGGAKKVRNARDRESGSRTLSRWIVPDGGAGWGKIRNKERC